jgi:peptidylprolyl isomerase
VVIVSRSYTSPEPRALVARCSYYPRGYAGRGPGKYPHAFVGTDKRERQKVGKQTRAAAEFTAARRAKTRRTAVRVTVGVIAILAVLFGYSALQGDDDSDTASDETTSTTAAEPTTTTAPYSNPELAQEILDREAPDVEPPPENTPADALEKETLIEGEGEAAAAGDQLRVNYVGVTPDGTAFDSSFQEGREPIPVALGQGGVIPGWDQGLVGVKIGERVRLVIGSENAYGAQGNSGAGIPPNSPLAFVVDVVDITPGTPAGGSGG